MKKSYLLPLLAIFSVGMVGCNETTVPQLSDVIPEHSLEIKTSGDFKQGEVVTLTAYLDNSPIEPDKQGDVRYVSSDESILAVSGRKAECLKAGDVNLTATYNYEGKDYTQVLVITVEAVEVNYISIKEAIAQCKPQPDKTAVDAEPAIVTVRGVVTESYGKGGVIDDGTGALEIYNWYSDKTVDTAFLKVEGYSSYGVLKLGSTIECKAYIYSYYGQPELSGSYQSSTDSRANSNGYVDLEGRYCKLVSEDALFTVGEEEELDEAGIKKLTAADSGKRVKFRATYVDTLAGSGSASQGTVKAVGDHAVFKVGSTNVQVNVHKKEASLSVILNWWNELDLATKNTDGSYTAKEGVEVIISTVYTTLHSSYGQQFYLGSQGTTITLA